jgi:hypothetical protein
MDRPRPAVAFAGFGAGRRGRDHTDTAAIDRARASLARGEGIPHEDILREFGLARAASPGANVSAGRHRRFWCSRFGYDPLAEEITRRMIWRIRHPDRE